MGEFQPVPTCDPSELWMHHRIRWCDGGREGPGWYGLVERGRRYFYVRVNVCPHCRWGMSLHPRPDAWLAAGGAAHVEERRAGDAVELLERSTLEREG